MPKRPIGKGRGADIFLGEADHPIKKRPTPKGRGAEVFLGPEVSPRPLKRPPLLAPAAMEAALDRVRQTLTPSIGPVDRSHLIVMLWLRVALKEANL
ncbi:MAG: hypothetical protein ACYC6G_01815 [Desulfobaccales bacterium]